MRTGHMHRNRFLATSLMSLLACAAVASGCSSSSHDASGSDGSVGDCPAGTAGPACAECNPGLYCAGGNAKAIICPPGTEDDDSDPATPCKLASGCPAGSYLMTPRFGDQMPMCTPCPSGSFSDTSNSTSCTQWTNCDPGSYVATVGSRTSDRVCETCPTGTDSSAQNAAQCTTQSECPAGTAPATGSGGQGVAVCTTCLPGYYCPGGSTAARECGPVTWDDDQNPASPCIARDSCIPGTYVTEVGSTTVRRTCAMCAAGTYSDSDNATNCTACPDGSYNEMAGLTQCLPYSPCAAGFSPSQAGTTTSNQICAACSVGTYCAGGTAGAAPCTGSTWDNDSNPSTACASKTDCAAGQYITGDGTTTSDRTCGNCASGTFSATTNAVSCNAWSDCSAGTYVSNTPSATEDRVCSACAAGSSSSTSNASACDSCAAGSYNASAGAVACTACASGTYSNVTGAIACSVCGADTYSSLAGATTCTAYTSCDVGSYPSTLGTTTNDQVCSACSTAGTYCSGGTSQPVACASGTWDDDSDPSTVCVAWTNCQPGTYVGNVPNATTDRACTACPGGTVSTTENASGCTTCPGGTAPNGDQSGCI